MKELIEILAWTSLIVSLIPNSLNFIIIVLGLIVTFLGDKNAFDGFRIDWRFFVWLTMGVWPIVYFIIT